MHRRGDTYTLTYDDTDLPSHYGWKIPSRLEPLKAEYRRLKDDLTQTPAPPKPANVEQQVRKIIDALDDRGRWVSLYDGDRLAGQPKFAPGDRYIATAIFARNLERLSDCVASGKSLTAEDGEDAEE